MEELSPRAQAKRDQILQAAQGLFLQRGFAGTSMEAIREEAGVSKPTLYNYYSGKEELLTDCLRRLIGDSPQWFLLKVDENSLGTREGLREVFSRMAQRMVRVLMQPEYLALVRVIIAETPKFPRLGDIFRETVPEQGIKTISSVLRQANGRGVVEVANSEIAARMFAGFLITYVLMDGLLVGDGPPRGPTSERIEKMLDLYMKAICVDREGGQ